MVSEPTLLLRNRVTLDESGAYRGTDLGSGSPRTPASKATMSGVPPWNAPLVIYSVVRVVGVVPNAGPSGYASPLFLVASWVRPPPGASRTNRLTFTVMYRLPLMSNAMPSSVRSRGDWATTTGTPALPPVVSGTRTIIPESDTETYRLSRRNASSLTPMPNFDFGASSGSFSQMAAFPAGGSRQITPRLLSEIYRSPSWKASPFGKLSAGSVATRVTPPPAPIRNTPGGVGDASNVASATYRFPLGSKARPVRNPAPTSRLATRCCCPPGVTCTTWPM